MVPFFRCLLWFTCTIIALTQCGCDTKSSDPGETSFQSSDVEFVEVNCGYEKANVLLNPIRVPVDVSGQPQTWYCRLSFEPTPEFNNLYFSAIKAYTVAQTLVFTGVSLPPGDYDWYVRIYRYLSDAEAGGQSGSIQDAKFTLTVRDDCPEPSNTRHMNIKYECMQSYDIRYVSELQTRLEIEFGQANMDVAIHPDQVSIPNGELNESAFDDLILQHWLAPFTVGTADSVYLLSIQTLHPRPSDVPANALGFTRFSGNPGSYSTILKQKIDYEFLDEYDVREATYRTTTHELGHARAALPHLNSNDPYHTDPEHTAQFTCVMVTPLPVDSRGRL